ncbi:unnamed protein product [Effrenium voratum]|nr:unnamed protein product [Effrenium voratum]
MPGFCPAALSWRDFGNPRSQASNAFLSLPINVAGTPTKVAEISEELQERLTDEEHCIFERCLAW